MVKNCHVLVIEDEPLLSMQVREVLQDQGASSFAFASTQEGAVTAAVLHRPDFITSDVKLAHGTGPLAVDAIQKLLGEIPVVFMTATPADCNPCAPPGLILSKPIDETRLVAVFHQLIGD